MKPEEKAREQGKISKCLPRGMRNYSTWGTDPLPKIVFKL